MILFIEHITFLWNMIVVLQQCTLISIKHVIVKPILSKVVLIEFSIWNSKTINPIEMSTVSYNRLHLSKTSSSNSFYESGRIDESNLLCK